MSEKPRTQEQVRKERYFRQVMEAKVLGDLALAEIDEALKGNAEAIGTIAVQSAEPEAL